ncbi:hypothetical protein JCM10207_001369 [Rhodosporidiobolus poonsookiae]
MSASMELCPSSARRHSSSSRSDRFGSGGMGGSKNGRGPGPVTPAAVASSQLMFASSSTSVGVNEMEDKEDEMDAVRGRVAGSVAPRELPARGADAAQRYRDDISDTRTTSAGGKASGMARRSKAAASGVRATKRTSPRSSLSTATTSRGGRY